MTDDEIILILKSLIDNIQNSKLEIESKNNLSKFLLDPDANDMLKYMFLGWYMYNLKSQ